jgi:hypothetical protein
MVIEGFMTVDGDRRAVTLEIPGLRADEGEPLIVLAQADVLAHTNELTMMQRRGFDDPCGLRFCGATEGGYGHLSGNHRRSDDKQVMNSLVQFKKNEFDRGTDRLGGEITVHCLDGRLGQDDSAMKFVALFNHEGVTATRLVVDELVVNRVKLRGRDV